MRIGIAGPISLKLLDSYLEGAERLPLGYEFPQTAHIVRSLIECGHAVDVFTLDQSVAEPKVFHGDSLRVYIGRRRPRHRARDGFSKERADLLCAMQASDCQIIHAHWTYEFAMAALGCSKPSMITVRDWAPTILRMMPDPYRVVRLLMNVYTLRRGQHFSATSPYIQMKLYKWTRKKWPVIPNGLPDEYFSDRRTSDEERKPVLISVNNGFGRRKNVESLLRAFVTIRSVYRDAELWLVGSGYEPVGRAERWARTRGLTDGVQFLGPKEYENMLDLMRKARVLVHPSLEESFGMTLVEAMAQRTPVVGGENSGAVPWVLAGGKAGTLADVTDSNSLADAVLALLKEPDIWKQQSEAGYWHSYDNFRLSQIVNMYVEEYKKVLTTYDGIRAA